MTTIRNFIYLNIDTLNSLYSQVFEGVAEAIVESYFATQQSTDQQKNIGKTLEEKVGELSGSTTNKVLHDHMYNKFEEKIKEKIVECNGNDAVLPNSFIKVTGKTRIEDYDRLSAYLDKFNDLGLKVTYMNSDEATKKGKNLREIARQNGLQLDKDLIKYLNSFIEMFEKHGYEVVVDQEKTSFSGILNTSYLRLTTDEIRILYGSSPCMEWTMVGQVTQVHHKALIDPETFVKEITDELVGNSIKEALSNLFTNLEGVESTFFQYGNGKVYHILPIAICIENNL